MLRLLKPKPRFDYFTAYIRMIESLDAKYPNSIPAGTADYMRLAYLFVMAINSIDRDAKDRAGALHLAYEATRSILARLTPEQFTQAFPPAKRYDGHKYQCKDYFTTMQAVSKLPLGQPIGEAIDDLLWDYMNDDTEGFLIRRLGALSNRYRAQAGRDMVLEFFEEQGTPITTYVQRKDPYTGQVYVLGSDGKTFPISTKPQLRVIAGKQ